eukprot:scaffold578_cov167-Amphora_coffeaeformis.AAC.30
MLALLRVTDCHSLSTLENAGCVSLNTLILQGVDALEYLNASALPIRRLVVAAMHLLHLELENCKDLDDCLIRSPRLQRSYRGVALLQGGPIGIDEKLLDASDTHGLVSANFPVCERFFVVKNNNIEGEMQEGNTEQFGVSV